MDLTDTQMIAVSPLLPPQAPLPTPRPAIGNPMQGNLSASAPIPISTLMKWKQLFAFLLVKEAIDKI